MPTMEETARYVYIDICDAKLYYCNVLINWCHACTSFVSLWQITFEFTETILGPIYVYYELTNYYQNNRRYIKSTSESQLLGQVKSHFLIAFSVVLISIHTIFCPSLMTSPIIVFWVIMPQ